MSEADEALQWAEYAEEDLIMAKSALRRSKPLTISVFLFFFRHHIVSIIMKF